MDKHKAGQLLDKYLQGEATEREKALVEYWLVQEAGKSRSEIDELPYEQRHAAMWDAVSKATNTRNAKLWPRIGIAAAVIGMAIGVYFYTSRHLEGSSTGRHPELVSGSQDIAPGKNKATMIVNGKSAELSDAKTGVVFAANNVKYTDGTEINNSPLPSDVSKITLVTQRGGMYSTILPDGSKAWLNAASNLEFPSTFENVAQRIVKTKGEVYFEVAKNKEQPFIVITGGQQIEVLGTHFNVSNYDGEEIRTTLLEGSLRVRHLEAGVATRDLSYRRDDEQGVILKPNQQSLVTENAEISVKNVDANEAVFWKAGKFSFTSEEMGSVMQKVARWYNIDVAFKDGTESIKVTGSAPRFANISTLLNMLEQTGLVHFKIEGRKVYVSR